MAAIPRRLITYARPVVIRHDILLLCWTALDKGLDKREIIWV